ncbi:MAG TPA: folylpolyglutamate synthase/dihydrofolate synthase family protein, partial [Chromatiaceae bacterium]|nr:folylpolyglutamate synthase/dihydrofolate synthase family protein [Chromatiaceae bacterium]
WQETLNPSTIHLGLDRVLEVWGRIHPGGGRLPFPVITVGGTNGKGSCVAMLEAIYRAGGYRTGCYSSPHLLRYTERIRLDGTEVGEGDLCAAFQRVDQARGDTRLTFFEFGTLAALDLFLRAAPDLAILEVGLGGRLDAVNLIDPDLSLVTTIARDHMAWLGDTLDAIALEKAGIFRQGRPALIGSREPPPARRRRAEEIGAQTFQLGQEFDAQPSLEGWRWQGPGAAPMAMPLPALRGGFQRDNAATVLMATALLQPRLPLSANALRQGLQRVRLAGRFQVFPGEPTLILDVAHNGQAAESLAANLGAYPCRGRRHAVLGVLRDKAVQEILKPLLHLMDTWDLGRADDPRALPVEELRAAFGPDTAATVAAHPDLAGALAAALARCQAGDCVVVFGSFTTVEAALRLRGLA